MEKSKPMKARHEGHKENFLFNLHNLCVIVVNVEIS